VPFHDTASSVPLQTAIQNDGPAHDNDGGPVAPEAAPVWIAALHRPDRYRYAWPSSPSAMHEVVVGQVTAPRPPDLAMRSGEDHPGGRETARVVEVDRPVWLVRLEGVDDVVVPALFAAPHAEPSSATAMRMMLSLEAAGARCDQLMGIFRPYFNGRPGRSRRSPSAGLACRARDPRVA
jgi:hypothetical protein